ncbi:MAG TPA: hypothetical protein ENK48_00700 [Gammaproteobacteria bacterium]|nr:hypothetical protein [Gammaproteobacteria bacterium]
MILGGSVSKLVFCSGLPRSGSTWSYNVCRILLEAVYGEERVAKGYVGERQAVEALLFGKDQKNLRAAAGRDIILIKFHYPTPRLFDLVATGQALNVYTLRNPLTALASCMEFFNASFNTALSDIVSNLQAMEEWRRHEGTLVVHHDDIIAAPDGQIRRIAAHLGLEVDEEQLRQCAEATSYEAMKRLSQEMASWPQERLTRLPNHTFDPVTLLHVGHVSKGKSRDWREQLTPDQIETARRVLRPWLDEDAARSPAS